MSAMNIFCRGDIATPQSNDLDEMMRSTERFGNMGLSRMEHGWWARIEMKVITTGATFKIESEYSSKTPKTPIQAVQQCIERMNTALETLGVQP